MNEFFLSCKECRIENPRSFYGSFYIGPFNGSQSLTVANSLRRTLLSELTGIAITSVQIDSVEHEFSTLTGVRESVLDILLNLKEIVLKSSSFLTKTQIGYLQAYGPGVIRAGDLLLPLGIQCVDPNQYIATLSQNGKLIMKFTINEGKNYIIQKPKLLKQSILNQQNNLIKNFKTDQSIILLDAIFMPINKVNYMIEPYNYNQGMSIVKQNLPFINQNIINKESKNEESQIIIFEIWTNGSLHPRQALYNGLNNLMNLFLQLEKMKILSYIFQKNIGKSKQNYKKLIQKVDHEYSYYNKLEKG